MKVKFFKHLGSKLLIVFSTMILLIALIPNRGVAASMTLTVNSTNDAIDANPGDGVCATSEGSCTLRAAIQESNALESDDVIILPSGSYALTIAGTAEDEAASGDLDMTDHLTLIGEAVESTIINGNNLDRVLHIVFTETIVHISNVQIMNGQSRNGTEEDASNSPHGDHGGGIYNAGLLSLKHCVVSSNRAGYGSGISFGPPFPRRSRLGAVGDGGDGGGIYNAGTLTLNECMIDHNRSGGGGDGGDYGVGAVGGLGGGVYNAGSMTLENCNVNHNSTASGGSSGFLSGGSAGSGAGIYNAGTLQLNACQVHNNTTANGGGGRGGGGGGSGAGIYNAGTASTIIANSFIHHNLSGDGGGGEHGAGGGAGGGIANAGTFELTDSVVNNNRAGNGGFGSSPGAGGAGGGIFNRGSFKIQFSAIISNHSGDGIIDMYGSSSAGSGGGIYNNGALTMTNGVISHNDTGLGQYYERVNGGGGGGVYNRNTLAINNSTISGNQVIVSSEAISDTNGEGLRIGGGIFNREGLASIQNTLIAGNHSGDLANDCSTTSPLTSQGYNLIQDVTECSISGETTGNLIGVDPLLAPLANYGGSTETHALLDGSPAIDAGNPAGCVDESGMLLESDQRHIARAIDGDQDGHAICDIGAYEFWPPSNSTTITADGGHLSYSYPAHHTSIWMPASAISSPFSLTITYQPPPTTTSPLLGMDHFFVLSASPPSSTLPIPFPVTIRYSETVRAPIIPGTESLYKWQDGQWLTAGITVIDRQTGTFTAQIEELGLYGVMGETNSLYLPVMFR